LISLDASIYLPATDKGLLILLWPVHNIVNTKQLFVALVKFTKGKDKNAL